MHPWLLLPQLRGQLREGEYHSPSDTDRTISLTSIKESFYSKLKTFSDDNNTNLYVSNLPKSMNEHDLAQLFLPHKVCSSRILRDKNGHGRGVGFARYVHCEIRFADMR